MWVMREDQQQIREQVNEIRQDFQGMQSGLERLEANNNEMRSDMQSIKNLVGRCVATSTYRLHTIDFVSFLILFPTFSYFFSCLGTSKVLSLGGCVKRELYPHSWHVVCIVM
jgi:predicted PurR-regulated permease PerM